MTLEKGNIVLRYEWKDLHRTVIKLKELTGVTLLQTNL